MSALLLLLLSFFHYGFGQIDIPLEANTTNHCINELQVITATPIQLNLSNNPSRISPNYSVATSVAYHINSSTILIAGDFFYIDAKNPKHPTYYQFFQAFSHTKDNKFNMKYEKYGPFTNPSFGNKYISHKSLTSWTRIIAHPSLPYFYLLGINNLTAYNVYNGQFLWTAMIPSCSAKHNNDRPIIYNDGTFFKSDNEHLYVGGSCVDQSGKTVIVLDEYDIGNGKYNATFRNMYNLTDLGFFKNVNILDGFGIIPPEVTINAPINESITTKSVNKYFYVGFTHLMFTGIARIEHNVIDNRWRAKKWPNDWTLVNPSFVSHRSVVTTNKGLISLLDPSINGLISLFLGKMKHFTRWDTEIKVGEIEENNKYNTFTWYGGHEKYDLHLDWTLFIDPLSGYNHIYVTTAPSLQVPRVKNSTIAKHDVETGQVIGGTKVPFYALDSIVTNDGQLITVGFQWTPSSNFSNINISSILPYLERKAVFSVYYNKIINNKSCIGCDIDYYDSKCLQQCLCENGYCHDDINGDGKCYCTMMSYGPFCRPCDGLDGSCDPTKGLCNSGPNGDGKCKFCYETNISRVSFDVGLGDHYGPECADNCTCSADNGVCYTTGDLTHPHAGECLYCTNPDVFGTDCDMICDCNYHTQYCSNGVHGTGCVNKTSSFVTV